jgi:hypothetical protein
VQESKAIPEVDILAAMPRKGEPKDEKYDEVTFAGISLRAYHGFKETKDYAQVICEQIANLKDEILKCLKFIEEMERRDKRALEVVLYLTDPEDDMKRYRQKKPRNPAEGYSLNIHFVDTWRQRRDIYESYEISIEHELRPTAIYVHMRFLDTIYNK